MDAHYMERGTLVAVGNLIAIKQIGQDGKLIEEILYRITKVDDHAYAGSRPYFFVSGTHVAGKYEDMSWSKGELEEMLDNKTLRFFNES